MPWALGVARLDLVRFEIVRPAVRTVGRNMRRREIQGIASPRIPERFVNSHTPLTVVLAHLLRREDH